MPIFDYQIRVLEEKLNEECEGPNTTCKVSMFGAILVRICQHSDRNSSEYKNILPSENVILLSLLGSIIYNFSCGKITFADVFQNRSS